MGQPAAAITVWVTRDEPATGPMCAALRAAGLEPVCQPVVERRVTADVRALLADLGPEDWLVLTSAFAIAAIPTGSVRCRVAVVGAPSRDAAEARGLRVARVSPDGTGDGLWRSLREKPDGAARICYPRSSLADAPVPWEGVDLRSPILYVTTPRAVDAAALRGVGIAAVASPSAASALGSRATELRCASIGPTTSGALRRLGVEPWVEAVAPTFESLAGAIALGVRRVSGSA